MKTAVTSLKGFNDVSDIVPNGSFMKLSDVWLFSIGWFRDEAYNLRRRAILELVADREEAVLDIVRVTMLNPQEIVYEGDTQILGFDILDVSDRGLDTIRYEVYDYEMSGFSIMCSDVILSRVAIK